MHRPFVIAAILLMAACTSVQGPDVARKFDSFRAVETRDFTGYTQVYIAQPVAADKLRERVGLRTIRRRIRPIGERDISQMLNRLDDDLNREVGRVAEIVGRPGPGVLTVETVLTDLNANRPTLAELSIEPSLSFQSLYAGDAAVTIRLLEEDRLLAEIKDRDNVDSLFDGVPLVFGMWDTAERQFNVVAARLGALLRSDEAV